MKAYAFHLLLGSMFIIANVPAWAGTKTFTVNGSDLETTVTLNKSFQGVALRDALTDTVYVNISLPDDYKKNSPVSVKARLMTLKTYCNIALKAEGTFRARAGEVYEVIPGSASGFTIDGPQIIAVPATNMKVFTKGFTLNKPLSGSGPLVGQLAKDNIILVFSRVGGSPVDTCTGNLLVTSVRIVYQTP
jgi:hypothetical protein